MSKTNQISEHINDISQYLTPSQRKRLERKVKKNANNEQPTYAKTERHHQNKIASIRPIIPKTQTQKYLLDCLDYYNQNIVTGPAGVGKTYCATTYAAHAYIKHEVEKIVITRPTVAVETSIGFFPGPQPLDANILTPDRGWVKMGDLVLGDYVIARDGNPAKVLGIYPKGVKKIYKITTNENKSTECCEDHLWFTTTHNDRTKNKRGSIKSTKEIIDTLYHNNKPNHHIPRNDAVNFYTNNMPLSPYLLGCLLGDGCLSDAITLTNQDKEIIKRCEYELSQYNCKLSHNKNTISYTITRNNKNSNKPAKKVKMTNLYTKEETIYESTSSAENLTSINKTTLNSRCVKKLVIDNIKYEFLELDTKWSNPIKEIISNLGLLKTHANTKFIPEIYKYHSSINDRLNLLRGLMDTDGHCCKSGEAGYTTTSEKLANDIIELVNSLGGKAKSKIILPEKDNVRLLNSKEIKSNHIVYNISINLPNDMNPFFISRKHDRFKTKFIHGISIKKIEHVGEKEVQCILIDNPEHLYITDQYIVTHNTIDEKMSVWLAETINILKQTLGSEAYEIALKHGDIEIVPFEVIRGRSLNNSFILLTEAQNTTVKEMMAFVTRTGENSRVVIDGDINQSDIGPSNGLVWCLKMVKQYESLKDMSGIIEFTADDIVRSGLCGAWVRAIEHTNKQIKEIVYSQ